LQKNQVNKKIVAGWFVKAAAADPDYCFPNRIEDVNVLQEASLQNPSDPMALTIWKIFGTLIQYAEAIEVLGESRKTNPKFCNRSQKFGLGIS